jgi:DNA-binding XRE family transcriptional regulator
MTKATYVTKKGLSIDQKFYPTAISWGLPEHHPSSTVDLILEAATRDMEQVMMSSPRIGYAFDSSNMEHVRAHVEAYRAVDSVGGSTFEQAHQDDIRGSLGRLAAAQAASLIRLMRESVGLTQNELAARMNVSRRWIAALESNSRRRSPSLLTLYRVAAACNQRLNVSSQMKE